jgi:hypothetical protein
MQQQTTLDSYFQRNITPNHSPDIQTRTNPVFNSQTLDLEVPEVAKIAISKLSIKYASILCLMDNIQTKINEFNHSKETGSIPKQLEFKFKKLYTKEHESNLRTAIITTTIEFEINQANSKLLEQQSKYNQRHQDLQRQIQAPLNDCGFNFDMTTLSNHFDNAIRSKKFEFTLKKLHDQEKKQFKREKFLKQQEKNNQIATITSKDLSNLQKQIKDLKIQLQKPKSNSKNEQRDKSKNIPKAKVTVKPTGTGKRKNGKPKSSRKNK